MISKLLESKRLYISLIIINVLTILALFVVTRHEVGSDAETYQELVKGIMHGRYSFWWFLPEYQPDTLRNPGYPLFLAGIEAVTHSLMAVRIVQLGLYLIAIYFLLQITDHYTKRVLTKNIMLILLMMSLNVSVFVNLIYPEMLALFLLITSIYLELKVDDKKWYKYILLGIFYGLLFEARPALLFIPFIKLAYDWYYRKAHRIYPVYKAITFVIMFLIMLPYGFWNKKEHGIFSVTCIEGGEAQLFAGFWSYKLPNYTAVRYWGLKLPSEVVSEKDSNKVKQNIVEYNKECDYIDSICQPYLTKNDSLMLSYVNGHGPHSTIWPTYNAKYIRARHKVFKQLVMQHYRDEPLYTIKYMTYTCFRLWYSGLFFDHSTVSNKMFSNLAFISPFFIASLLSFIVFLLALIFIPIASIKNPKAMSAFIYPILLILYFGVIHCPFNIQSRYTTPVKLILIMVIAQALTVIFFPKSGEKTEAGN